MKFTNEKNLPRPLVRAMSWGKGKNYCDLSVTQLLKPPRQRVLEKIFDDQIEVDVADNLWAFLGSAMHYVLERLSYKQNSLAEEKLTVEILGKRIGGTPDLYYQDDRDGKWVLVDLKTTSHWSFIFDPKGKEEWHKQTNIYAYMLEQHGFHVDRIEIWGIARDWSATELKRDPERYPKSAISIIDIPIRPMEKIKKFLEDRVKVHIQAEENEKALPLCTDDERWAKPGKLAVMIKGQVKAKKLFENTLADRKEAEQMATKIGGFVQERPATYTKCQDWCSASAFCTQWQETQKQMQRQPDLAEAAK